VSNPRNKRMQIRLSYSRHMYNVASVRRAYVSRARWNHWWASKTREEKIAFNKKNKAGGTIWELVRSAISLFQREEKPQRKSVAKQKRV